MKASRIGTVKRLVWPIKTNGEDISLEGRSISLCLLTPKGQEVEVECSVHGSSVEYVFDALTQNRYGLGVYGLTLYENKGTEWQAAVDHCEAVRLIARTPDECCECDGDADVKELIKLEGRSIKVFTGLDAYTRHEVDERLSGKLDKPDDIFEPTDGLVLTLFAGKPVWMTPSANVRPEYPGTGGGGSYDDTELRELIEGKQETIEDLESIRDGASKGATAVQPSELERYVLKEEGKVLSDNSYTDEDKRKVEGAIQKPSDGTDGQILTLADGMPVWENAPEGGGTYDDTEVKRRLTELEGRESVIINGNVTNNADEEDLHADESTGKISLANRTQEHGMAYKILRRDKTFVSQVPNNASGANTIYEIRYDFDLTGLTVTIPQNAVLRFNGGSIRNANKIVFQATTIEGNAHFEGNKAYDGSILNDSARLSWFSSGMKGSNNVPDSTIDLSDVLVEFCMFGQVCGKRELLSNIRSERNLDFENIPLCIKRTVTLSSNCSSVFRNALIFFYPSEDYQCMLEFASDTEGAVTMKDCEFINKVESKANVCCLRFNPGRNWSYANFTNVCVNGFTGYFYLNQGYLQQALFNNVVLNGGGIYSSNTENLWGEKRGTSNIVDFRNCSVNNGSYSEKSDWTYFIDLGNSGETNLTNIVLQSKGGVAQHHKGAVYLSPLASTSCVCNINGLWREYGGSSVIPMKIDGACTVYNKKSGINDYEIVSGAVNIYDEGYRMSDASCLLANTVIDEERANVSIYLNAKSFLNQKVFHFTDKILGWINRGIIKEFNIDHGYHSSDDFHRGAPVKITNRKTFDQKAILIQSLDTVRQSQHKFTGYLSSHNGITICNIEQPTTGTYNALGIDIPKMESMCHSGIYCEIIYRMTLLEDVTEDNKSNFLAMISNSVGDGRSSLRLWDIAPGMKAGDTTGWVRKALIGIGNRTVNNRSAYLNIKGSRLEIAYFKSGYGTFVRDESILIDPNGELYRNDNIVSKEILSLGISDARDNLTYVRPILENCTTCMLQTAGNIYYNDGGVVKSIIDKSSHSGNTASRPTGVQAGYFYNDTTLGKPIWWNGSKWVDANGNNV